jgi:hypothetical protein
MGISDFHILVFKKYVPVEWKSYARHGKVKVRCFSWW